MAEKKKIYVITMFKGTGPWARRDTYEEALKASKEAKKFGYDGEIIEKETKS